MLAERTIGGIALLIALVVSGCSGAEEAPQRIDRDSDEAAIRATLASNWEAANRKDVDGVVSTFVADGDAWIVGSSRVSGPEEIRRVEEDWQNTPGFRSYDGRMESVRFISPDAAIVEMTGTTTLDSGEINEETTVVVVRRGGEWRITAWRVMSLDGPGLAVLLGGADASE